MADQELLEKIESVESSHQELAKNFDEKHEAILKDIAVLKKTPAKKRDLWDKLGTLTPLISGVLISGIGIYFTHSNNVTQHKIQEVQTIEKLIPHLTGDESEKKMAIIAISTLTTPQTAAKIAQMFPSKGTVQALKSIADQGTKAERTVAKKALVTSMKALGEGMQKNPENNVEAQKMFEEALQVQEDVYGANSAKTVDTLVRIARLNEKQGNIDAAISYYDKARQTLIQNKRDKTSDFKSILRHLSRLYKQNGKMGLAKEFHQKANKLGKDLDAGKVNDKASIISAPKHTPSADSAESVDDFQQIQGGSGTGAETESVPVTVPDQKAATDSDLFPGDQKKNKNSMDSPFSN